jgi:hypothetical protein
MLSDITCRAAAPSLRARLPVHRICTPGFRDARAWQFGAVCRDTAGGPVDSKMSREPRHVTPISFRPISLKLHEKPTTQSEPMFTHSNPQTYPHGRPYQTLMLRSSSLFVTRHCEAQGADNPLKHPHGRRAPALTRTPQAHLALVEAEVPGTQPTDPPEHDLGRIDRPRAATCCLQST